MTKRILIIVALALMLAPSLARATCTIPQTDTGAQLINDINACLSAGGGLTSPLTADLAAGAHKITGLANGTASGDALSFGISDISDLAIAAAAYNMNSNKLQGLASATIAGDALAYGQAGAVLLTSLTLNGASSGSDVISVAAAAGTGTKVILPPNNGATNDVWGNVDGAGTTGWTHRLFAGSTTATITTSYSLDCTLGNTWYLTLSAATTISFSGCSNNQDWKVKLCENGTGGFAVTWPGTVKWSGGVQDTQTTTASKCDWWSFNQDSAGVISSTGFRVNVQ